ncbi:MAG: hypothetical protein K1X92_15805 [Bacteroidia bacterium]|nr:hypothetical protein [Bacteroidia bacterium]
MKARAAFLKNSTEQSLYRYPLRMALIINFFLFAFYCTFYTLYFQTNDDTGMMLRLSGKLLVKSHTEYVLFINLIFARLLKFLYISFPDFPWYGSFFVLFLYLSFTFLLYLLLRHLPKLITLGLYLVFFTFLGYTILVSLQFTSVSGLMAISGLWGLLRFPLQNKMRQSWIAFAGGFLYCMAGLLRFESWILVTVLFIPIGIWIFYQEKKAFLHRIIPLTMSVFMSLLAYGYHQYGIQKYDNYAVFNQVRGELLDYNLLDRLEDDKKTEILQSAGWGDTELNLMKTWMFMDTGVYSYSNLQKIVKAGKENQTVRKIPWWESPQIFVRETMAEQKSHLIITLSFLLICLRFMKRKEVLPGFLLILFSVLVFSSITYYLKSPPPRIVINGLIIVHSFVLFSLRDDIKTTSLLNTPGQKFLNLLQSGLFLIYLLYSLRLSGVYYDCTVRSLLYQENFRKGIATLKALKPEKKCFISWAGALPFEYISPFRDTRFLDSVHVFTLGSLSRNRPAAQLNEYLGIKDFHRDAFQESTLFFIIDKHIETNLTALNHFQQKYYGQSILPEFQGILMDKSCCMFTLKAVPEIIPDSVLHSRLKAIREELQKTQPLK